jgi:hypothetical protein
MKVVCVNNKRYAQSLIEGKEYDVLLETGVMGCQRWYINGEHYTRLYLNTLLEDGVVLAQSVIRNNKIDTILDT